MSNSNSDWGIPDGMCASDYPPSVSWSEPRWSWEIIRRKPDIRDAFDRHAAESYRALKSVPDYDGPSPDDPGFVAIVSLRPSHGMIGIPNPRIGDQPDLEGLFDRRIGEVIVGEGDDYLSFDDWQICFIRRPCLAFIVDPAKPYQPQLAGIQRRLNELCGSSPKKNPRYSRLWPIYLRVLDAAEAGYSLTDISRYVLSDYHHRKNDPTAARDVLNQARRLLDNFQL
jgi:hypothetical protein